MSSTAIAMAMVNFASPGKPNDGTKGMVYQS